MCLRSSMIVQSGNDGIGFRHGISVILKHSSYQPHFHYIAGVFYSLLAFSEKRRMILGDDRLPHWNGTRISFNAFDSLLELFQNPIRWDPSKLRVERPNIGLFAHYQLFTGTGEHCSG